MKKQKQTRELIVDRALWLRGGNGELFDPLTKGMCILGLYLRQVVGVSSDKLLSKLGPEDVATEYSDPRRFFGRLANVQACWLVDVSPREGADREDWDEAPCKDSDAANALIMLNDNEAMSDVEREKQIKQHFKQFNVVVKFVGERKAYPTEVKRLL